MSYEQRREPLMTRFKRAVLRAATKFALGDARRSYAAAQFNRLTSDWTVSNASANSEIRQGLQPLRARSRELVRNEGYAARYLQLIGTNVVGASGIRMQSQVKRQNGKPVTALNQKIEDSWADWGKAKNCDVSAKQSWIDLQWLFIRTLAQDGEVLVRFIAADNQYGFALQFLDADWLDETYEALLPNGNRIIMSVEEDRYGRAVAYHLTPPMDYYQNPVLGVADFRRVRVPADELIHAFVVERPGQSRGVPWMSASMLRMQTLSKYEEAELVAARVSASKMGFIQKPMSDVDEDMYDEEGNEIPLLDHVAPGVLQELEPGYEFKEFNPQHPAGNYAPFTKGIMRAVAAGLGCSYNSLAQDLESVNFSSIRAGLLDEREFWKEIQMWMVEHFCEPVYAAWLKAVVAKGIILPSEYLKLTPPVWRARGWNWVDPVKDVQADILAAKNKFRSRSEMAAERGRDFEELLQEIAQEEALAKELGVELVTDVAKPSAKPESKPATDQGGQGDGNGN